MLHYHVNLKPRIIPVIGQRVAHARVGGQKDPQIAQDEVLEEHPKCLCVARQTLRGGIQERDRKRGVNEVPFGLDPHARLRAHRGFPATQVFGKIQAMEELKIRRDGLVARPATRTAHVTRERLVCDCLALVYGKRPHQTKRQLGRAALIDDVHVQNGLYVLPRSLHGGVILKPQVCRPPTTTTPPCHVSEPRLPPEGNVGISPEEAA